MAGEEDLKLFRSLFSPFALRIVWALRLKGVEYETSLEDLSNKSPELLMYNPVHKKVPVLVHRSKPIAESLVILEYIDETWKQNPLLPEHPYERATARFWAKFSDDTLFPAIWQVCIKQGKEQEEAMVAAMEKLEFVEEELRGGKKFFGGDAIGYLDLAFGWVAYLISMFEETIDFKIVDEKSLPLISSWVQNFSEVPVIKESCPPRDEFIVRFRAVLEPFRNPPNGSNQLV